MLLALAATAKGAEAQPSPAEKAAADTLYDQGKKLMASGKFEDACPKLAESQRLDPGVGTLLTLGECYDQLGRRASAWTTFREAAALAKERKQLAREKTARTRVGQLEPRLSKLIIDVPASSEVPGLTVKRGDEAVGKPVWGTAVPVDTGAHTVSASAPGHKPWSLTVRVEKDGQLVTVSVPSLPAEEKKVDPAARPPPGAEPDAARPGSTQRILGFTAGAVGLGGIGAGVVLGLLALDRNKEAQASCTPTCAAGGGDAIQADAQKLALGSTIGFTAGGILVAGGVVLILTAPSAKKSALRLTPVVTGQTQGVLLQGEF
jgi:hypothetical protein